jgi:type IV pilus assembly protein PilB
MGVAPYLISNSVVGIVAQRLVRKVCQFCKYETPATPEDIAVVGEDIPMITRGKGCKVCNNTGYKGRIAIHEMVYIDKTLKRMIARSADSQEMTQYAREHQGMKNLMDSVIELVKEGVTTPEEAMKIAYYSD